MAILRNNLSRLSNESCTYTVSHIHFRAIARWAKVKSNFTFKRDAAEARRPLTPRYADLIHGSQSDTKNLF